jgi:ABC-type phosphate/phosphonate transport system permease subunit
LIRLVCALLCLPILACGAGSGQPPAADKPSVLRVGLVPNRSPDKVRAQYEPFRALFRWECNLRAATVLGLVGAGGIGTELVLAFRLFRYHELLTLVCAVLALVVLIDVAGQVVRARLLDAPTAATCLPE